MRELALPPASFTLDTCEAVTGLSRRRMRDLLRTHADIPRTKVGKTIIVPVLGWLAWCERHSVIVPANDNAGEREAVTADDVLASVGLRRVK